MSGPGLVVFDLDGTLFCGEGVTLDAVWAVFDRHRIPRPAREEILSFFGMPTADFQKWLASLAEKGDGEEVAREVIREEIATVGERGELYGGVSDLLDGLTGRGHRLALCTNGDDPYVRTVLEGHGLAGRFDMVRHRLHETDRKPAMAREILDLIPSRPFAVVGDRADDVAAAKENDGFAVGAAYGFGRREELRGADVVVETPAEILPAIDRLFKGPAA